MKVSRKDVNEVGFLDKLFKRNEPNIIKEKKTLLNESSDLWQDIPAYLSADKEDYTLVATIASAIAANDQPKSTFIIKNIYKKNEQAAIISAIASAIAANDQPESTFVVKAIKEKK